MRILHADRAKWLFSFKGKTIQNEAKFIICELFFQSYVYIAWCLKHKKHMSSENTVSAFHANQSTLELSDLKQQTLMVPG